MSSKKLKNKSIAVFLQARILSKRLPGKIFHELCGKSMLKHIIDRVSKLKRSYNYLVVLAPKEDVEIFQLHLQNYPEVIIFPGDDENVLKRYYDANQKINSDIIIRITGDNPLLDIHHIKRGLLNHNKKEADYTYYNNLPLGSGFEIFNKEVLEKCYKKAAKKYHFEHVTPYIRENKEKFKINILKARGIFNHPEIRLTVDLKDDFKLMNIIYNNLYKGKPLILQQVIRFLLQNPDYQKINQHIEQRKTVDF